MYTFYIQNIQENIASLDETDSRHCIQVLRMKHGNRVNLIDGKGGFYEGIICSSGSRTVSVRLIRTERNYGKRNYFLHIAIAPTKNIDRFEWFIEKSAEIGIDEITPLLCHRSERKKIRNDRLEKILISAIKQSVNAYLPVLNPMAEFNSFISACREKNKYIAHCKGDQKQWLIHAKKYDRKFVVLIGPEGDFSDEEIILAENNNYIPVSLGRNRLRTETAGVVACQIISDLNTLKSG